MSTKKNIQQSLLNARKSVEATVAKNGTNSFHKYNYATAVDIIKACRDALITNGVMICPKGLKDATTLKNDTVVAGNFVYELIAEDGSSMELVVYAAGEDKGDKGPYKLMTGAIKYALIQLFLLETDDDPENDSGVYKGDGTVKGKPTATKEVLNKVAERVPEEGQAVIDKLKENFVVTPEQEKKLKSMLK